MRKLATFYLLALCQFGVTSVSAQIDLSDSEARRLLQAANGQEQTWLPIGEIRIKNGMNPDQSSVPTKRIFGSNMHSLLETFSRMGLVTVQDITGKKGFQVEFRYMVVNGTRILDALAGKPDQNGIILIDLGNRTYGEIVKNVKYTAQYLNPADDYRLVMGKYTYQATAFGMQFFAETKKPVASVYKFKALLKSDPFNKTYKLAAFDWGYVDRDTWETRSIQ